MSARLVDVELGSDDCSKKNAPFEGPIFQCLAMLTTSVGPMLTRQMHEVLDLMFPWGLSEPLYNALQVIASHIPPLLHSIQGRLDQRHGILKFPREIARLSFHDTDRTAIPAAGSADSERDDIQCFARFGFVAGMRSAVTVCPASAHVFRHLLEHNRQRH